MSLESALDTLCKGLRPATLAKVRVGWCVRHDRAACGDGWWVRAPYGFGELAVERTARLLGMDIPRAVKPHYRWEPRR